MKRAALLLVMAACGGRVLDEFDPSPSPPPPVASSIATRDASSATPPDVGPLETSIGLEAPEEVLRDARTLEDVGVVDAPDAAGLCASPPPRHDRHGTAAAPYCEGEGGTASCYLCAGPAGCCDCLSGAVPIVYCLTSCCPGTLGRRGTP